MRNVYEINYYLELEKEEKEMINYLEKNGLTDTGIKSLQKEGKLTATYKKIKKLNGE